MRQVRDTVWIGDCLDARDIDAANFDVVISMVNSDAYNSGSQDYWFPIFDGAHEYEDFQEAAQTFLKHFEDGESIFIHCQAGVSRSTAVATAAIAVAEEKSWDEVYADTQAGNAPVTFALKKSAKKFIQDCAIQRGFEIPETNYMELDDKS